MAIPDYETLMVPLLQFLSDGEPRAIDEATAHLADKFNLTEEERKERIPSGQSTYIKSRTGWARTYMKKAGLVSSPKRGFVQIADRGREALQQGVERINRKYLEQFPEFVEFQKRSNKKESKDDSSTDGDTPEETIEQSFQELKVQLADEILEQVRNCSPDFFERMVVELIVAMGYGGSFRDAAKATQRSNDGGIDGVIKEDRLGLDTIYIQAKKWDESRSIQRPEIQKFAGALQGVRARKGIFITTSSFSSGAIEYASSIESKIVLIDADQLAQYMIDFGIGVSPHQVYELKRLDTDYFGEVE